MHIHTASESAQKKLKPHIHKLESSTNRIYIHIKPSYMTSHPQTQKQKPHTRKRKPRCLRKSCTAIHRMPSAGFFCKRATNYLDRVPKMTYKDKDKDEDRGSDAPLPPCTVYLCKYVRAYSLHKCTEKIKKPDIRKLEPPSL